MANVISQLEMQEFLGAGKAVFPAGTVITPAARDWASDHNIRIEFEGASSGSVKDKASLSQASGRDECLKLVVKTVAREFQSKGIPLKEDTVADAVVRCLEKMGCRVEAQ